MKKYNVYITYKETRVVEVEAENEEQAEEFAYAMAGEAESTGDDGYEYQVEEIET